MLPEICTRRGSRNTLHMCCDGESLSGRLVAPKLGAGNWALSGRSSQDKMMILASLQRLIEYSLRLPTQPLWVSLQSGLLSKTQSAFILTFVQGDPEEDVLCMCKGDEQTWPCFVLFISWSVHSNRADYTLTWRKTVIGQMQAEASQQKS